MGKIFSLLLYSFFGIISVSESKNSNSSQENKIIGVWTVFFEDENVSNFDCNKCPTWEFKKDHTLIFTRYDKLQETTTWKVDRNGILHFGETLTGFQGTVPNKMSKMPVKMIFSKNNNYDELQFSHKGDITPVILRKKAL